MNPKISIALTILSCFIVGAVFNTVIALTSVFFPIIAIFTATLTGYAILDLSTRFIGRNK